jgi:hypothetical protein
MSRALRDCVNPSPAAAVQIQVPGASYTAAEAQPFNLPLRNPAQVGKSAPVQKQPRDAKPRTAMPPTTSIIRSPPSEHSDSDVETGDSSPDNTTEHRNTPTESASPHLQIATVTSPLQNESKQALSARCYLAWLHNRRKRFPTVPPNSSECAGLATKLELPKWKVYDEVLRHYLLETDSRRGQWHKERRLELLGEDPVFEE